MIAGYLRLSRDEDKKQYVSIENQRLILNQYAEANGFKIQRFYEDDNVSGYTFERPGMKQLLADIDSGLVDTVLAKDLSRIGRHNARVLLLIEDFKERGIRFVLVNDNYDSLYTEEDDILGIKTWYNERYIKDTSRKMKKVLGARQKNATLPVRPCFGYEVSSKDKTKVEIVEEEAMVIRKLFDLYLEGNGYRRIADFLNNSATPTPSFFMSRRKNGCYGKEVTAVWSSEMVRDILKNDYYIGTLRTHVRERKTINGTDKRVPLSEQYVFEHHHEAIIPPELFRTAAQVMEGRVRSHYRGQRKNYSIFSGCIFCKDCGTRMNLVRRTKRKKQTYFICRTYNAKGKKYCTAHTVEEEELLEAILCYLQICMKILKEDIAAYSLVQNGEREALEENLVKELDSRLYKQQKKLQVILEQKVSQITEDKEQEAILKAAYYKLERDTLTQIKELQRQFTELKKETETRKEEKDRPVNAVEILGQVIKSRVLTAKDIELLIERIIVDEDGSFEMKFRYSLTAIAEEDTIRELVRDRD